jgi:hypothetical protein
MAGDDMEIGEVFTVAQLNFLYKNGIFVVDDGDDFLIFSKQETERIEKETQAIRQTIRTIERLWD